MNRAIRFKFGTRYQVIARVHLISSGECRAAPSGRRPSDQATWLGLRVRLSLGS